MHPEAGRDFTREDDRPVAAPVAIISNPLWQGLHASDPLILGRAIRINNENYIIIGVMSSVFTGGPDADIWIPLRKAEDWTEEFAAYLVIGRLRPGVTREATHQELDDDFGVADWYQLHLEYLGRIDPALGIKIS